MALNFQQHEPASAGRLSLIIALAVSLVCVGLYQAEGATGPLHSLQSAVEGAMVPLQRASAPLTEAVDDAGAAAAEGGVTEETYATLRQQNEQLVQQLAAAEEQRLENERLRGLLEYSGSFGECSGVAASVTGRSTDIYFRVFTVNAGRNQGIDVDMPVICADGLVGRVTEVGATWSKVTAVIDAETSVPVMVERTRDNCMVRGVLNTVDSEAGMELYYLPRDRTDLVPGDTVITSGIGGIYPKGIKIGSVREVLTADGEANAIISPSVDFVHIEEVFIITGNGEG